MKCEVCGTVNNVGDAFCHNCGAFLQGSTVVGSAVQEPSQSAIGNNEVIGQYEINNNNNNENITTNNQTQGSSLIMDMPQETTTNINQNNFNSNGYVNDQINSQANINEPSMEQTINYNDLGPSAMNELNNNYQQISENQVVNEKKVPNTRVLVILGITVGVIILLVILYFLVIKPLFNSGEYNNPNNGSSAATAAAENQETTIGTDEYGFITVKGKWTKGEDEDKLVYTNSDDETIIININKAKSAIGLVNDEKTLYTDLKLIYNKLNVFNAYILSGKKDDKYIKTYIFEDNDMVTHYISAESNNETSEVFDSLTTFTLTK